MSELHRITVEPDNLGGRPVIRSLRIRVKDILDLLASGASHKEILLRRRISAIWVYAVRQYSIIVTKDEDFAQRRILSQNGPPILWLGIRNTRKQELLARFAL